jgi:hypothetical protein
VSIRGIIFKPLHSLLREKPDTRCVCHSNIIDYGTATVPSRYVKVIIGLVVELADTRVLGTRVARRGGSTPSGATVRALTTIVDFGRNGPQLWRITRKAPIFIH